LPHKELLIKKWHKLNDKAFELLGYGSSKEYDNLRLKMDDIEEMLWNDHCFDINCLINEEIWSEEIQETFK
jgi:hypothetical protein